MDEKGQLQWLEEFQRILRPGGLLFVSVIPLGDDDDDGSGAWDYRDPRGMVYRYRRQEVVKRTWMKEQAEIPHYIDSMHSENYCKTTWGELLEFRGFFPGAVRGYQALVVLRRRDQSDIDSAT